MVRIAPHPSWKTTKDTKVVSIDRLKLYKHDTQKEPNQYDDLDMAGNEFAELIPIAGPALQQPRQGTMAPLAQQPQAPQPPPPGPPRGQQQPPAQRPQQQQPAVRQNRPMLIPRLIQPQARAIPRPQRPLIPRPQLQQPPPVRPRIPQVQPGHRIPQQPAQQQANRPRRQTNLPQYLRDYVLDQHQQPRVVDRPPREERPDSQGSSVREIDPIPNIEDIEPPELVNLDTSELDTTTESQERGNTSAISELQESSPPPHPPLIAVAQIIVSLPFQISHMAHFMTIEKPHGT